jgi:hypothetical protein
MKAKALIVDTTLWHGLCLLAGDGLTRDVVMRRKPENLPKNPVKCLLQIYSNHFLD